MKKGWVRLHRQIEDNDLYFLESFTKAQAWIDLFLNANHKDGIISIRGNIINIKRGQIGWSELTLSKRWKWSKNKVRRFLKLLETEQQIKQQKTPITSIITILNYESYQSDDTTDDTTERQQKDSRRYTNNNVNNVNNDNKLDTNVSRKDEHIVSVIDSFKGVNPSYKVLFGNKTQRACADRMVKEHGLENILNLISILPTTNTDQYFTTITTPHQLESNMGKLQAYISRQSQKEIINLDNI